MSQSQRQLKVPEVSLRELMEVGAHFGHHTAKWNPKMKRFIHTSRNGVYIINLQQTVGMFQKALEGIQRIAASGQKVLFVGTKRQAQEAIKEEAGRAKMPYVSERWIGGCLTNYHTIKRSIGMMKNLQRMFEEKSFGTRKKKEILVLKKKLEKLELYYSGIQDMTELPGALFVIDPNREYIAVAEARVLGIPIFATLDTNCDPDVIDYPIPGNDDSMRAIRLYAARMADSIVEGAKVRQAHITSSGEKTESAEIRRADGTREVSLKEAARPAAPARGPKSGGKGRGATGGAGGGRGKKKADPATGSGEGAE